MKWKQHFYTKKSSNNLLLNMAVWWGCISRRGRSRGVEGILMSNLAIHRWYDMEKLTVPGSSNISLSFSGAQKQSFLLKRWKKIILHFVLLNQIQIGFSKIIGEGWPFSAEVRSLLSKFSKFTHIVSCWSYSHEIVEKWNTKLSPETDRTSHEFSKNLRLRILGNEQILRLFTWVFID